MNILFISKAGDALSLAQRVQAEGHNTYLYIYDKQAKSVGDGMVEKPHFSAPIMTEERHKCLKGNALALLRETQPDLVVFDMVKMGDVAEYVMQQRIPVFGACKWADFAELDRAYGYQLMKAVGIRTPITHTFTSGEREKAIQFVEKTKKRYVYKPSGNIDTSHTYVSRGAEDMIAMLKLWKDDKCDFELQEFVEGVEVSCEMWWNGMSAHLHNWTMEEKKFMNDNVGPTVGCAGNVVSFLPSSKKLVKEGIGKMERLLKKTNYRGPIDLNSIVTKDGLYGLEFTCYDIETEILTKEGWKLIKDVKLGEEVMTLNVEGYAEWQPTIGTISKNYRGNMVQIKNDEDTHHNLDILVTPDHNMLVKTRCKDWHLVPAFLMNKKDCLIRRSAKWRGEKREIFTIPEYLEGHCAHGKYVTVKHKSVEVPMETIVQFIGIYLAEGSLHYRDGIPYQVHISQSTKIKEVENIIKKMPFNYSRSQGFLINSVQLGTYLDSLGLGKCNTKFVPSFIKELEPHYIQLFLKAYALGDGSIHKGCGQVSYMSTSKKLIDDIQELLMKIGKVGNIRVNPQKGTECTLKGQTYIRNYDLYTISERSEKVDASISSGSKSLWKLVPYDGTVHCVTVPNGVVYVRRNGRPFFAGNCRFGYDAVQTLLELYKGSLAQLLFNIATGNDKHGEYYEGVAIGVRISIPPYPHTEKEVVRRIPIIGTNSENLRHIWLGDVKAGEEYYESAGSDGNLGCVTARGKDVRECRRRVYRTINNLIIPQAQYRTDIGERVTEDVQKLREWGYL